MAKEKLYCNCVTHSVIQAARLGRVHLYIDWYRPEAYDEILFKTKRDFENSPQVKPIKNLYFVFWLYYAKIKYHAISYRFQLLVSLIIDGTYLANICWFSRILRYDGICKAYFNRTDNNKRTDSDWDLLAETI